MRRPHRHRPASRHLVRQQAGIPYEVERRVCTTCGQVLEERRLRRAAA